MNILILGGCGYIGTILVEKLLKNKKNNLTIIDTQWFGNYILKNKRIKIKKIDLRNVDKYSFKNIDHIIPCIKFDLSKLEEQEKCFHYTNLQPLWWYDNCLKGGK